jgi:DNA-binding XRE family transcriptional regulator
MSNIDKLIEKRISEGKDFKNEYQKENERLQVAVALMELREAEGLTQRQLAAKTGKPQSTIARIENGNMNASIKIMDEIASSLGKKLEIRFV